MVYNSKRKGASQALKNTLKRKLEMTKKFAFVILWLTFSFVLAQAPERTKPASAETVQTQPCWEKEIKSEFSPENKACYLQFLAEVDTQLQAGVNKQGLENLELDGVRFAKAMGISESSAIEIVRKHFTALELKNVLKTPAQKQEVSASVVAPAKTLEAPPAIGKNEAQDSMLPPDKRRNARVGDTGFLASQAARDEIIKRRAQQIDLQKEIDRLQKVRRNEEDPIARKARKEIEKQEEKEWKYKKLLEDASVRSKVEGCKDPIFSFDQPVDLDPQQMWVKLNAAALPPSRILGVPYSRQWIQIRVINPMRATAVDIEFNDRYLTGVVVKNLCPGGRVTLYRQRVPWVDDNQMRISLNAIRSDGRITQRSYSVSAWDYRRGQFPTWILPK